MPVSAAFALRVRSLRRHSKTPITRAPARSASATSRFDERLALERLEVVEQRQQEHGRELGEANQDR